MAKTIQVEIVSAEQSLFSGECQRLIVTGELGELGIEPEHAPLLTSIRPGEIQLVSADGAEDYFYVSGGMLEVLPHQVTILADTAVRAQDLDEAAAEQARKSAEEAMADQKSEFDYSLVETELAQAMAQLKAIKRLRGKTK